MQSESTSSAEDFPVRTSPTPAEALASLVTEAVSGASSRASSGYFDPESSSWRTFQLSLLEDSTLCSVILRKAGTMRSGFLYELPTLERRTFESGSSSSDGGWPTPDASVSNDGQDPESYEERRQKMRRRKYNGNSGGTPLAIAAQSAQRSLWPTPKSSDADRGGDPKRDGGEQSGGGRRSNLVDAVMPGAKRFTAAVAVWPTPTKADAGQAGDQYAGGNPTLLGKVKMWPTATTSDADGSRRHGYMDEGNSGTTLTDAALAIMQDGPLDPMTPKDGRATRPRLVLNPRFVEALQGFPDRWTAMDPSSFLEMRRTTRRARHASKRSGTRSSRSARKSSAK